MTANFDAESSAPVGLAMRPTIEEMLAICHHGAPAFRQALPASPPSARVHSAQASCASGRDRRQQRPDPVLATWQGLRKL
jgi:hypothetical protein